MIHSINSLTFTGKTYSKRNIYSSVKKEYGKWTAPKKEVYNRYGNTQILFDKVNLEKDIWGYRFPRNSQYLKLYAGSLEKDFGLSTESGGYGGGWLKADIDTPLSTKDVHTCALLNLINDFTNEQLLYHVYYPTKRCSIIKFIEKEFPRFTRVNIMPGDQLQTNNTVNDILYAVNQLNSKAPKSYYHMPVENPEVIALNGELQYLPNTNPDVMSFREVTDLYNY